VAVNKGVLMTLYLTQLKEAKIKFNQAAITEEINKLSEYIGKPLPKSIIELYHNHNGQPHSHEEFQDGALKLCFRLLSIDELIEILEVLSDEGFDEWREVINQYIPCWTDDEGNYMAFYASGDFVNRVAYLSHEVGPLPELSFPSLEDFYLTQLDLAKGKELNFDEAFLSYFAFDSLTDDEKLFYKSMNLWRNTQDELWRHFYGKNALQLCPIHRLDELLELSTDKDTVFSNYVKATMERRRR
jgi:hypothetical protein